MHRRFVLTEAAIWSSAWMDAVGLERAMMFPDMAVEIVVLVGLPASGKSTFFRERFAATHEHVSKDLLRNNKNPNRRQAQLITAALEAGQSVVVDNTNPAVEDRRPLIELGREHGARVVGYFFDARVRECLRRNAGREGRAQVPDVAIFAAARRLVPPSYPEGFDELFRVSVAEDPTFEVHPVSGPESP
jgi:predicted kinase